MDQRYIVTDVETSGISPHYNSLLSIGAVNYMTGDEFYGECYCDKAVNEKALEINGFTLQQIKDFSKDSPIELVRKFFSWSVGFHPKPIMMGHNVGHFDILFLEEVHASSAISEPFPFSYRTIDLHSLAFAKFKESLTHERICQLLGLPVEPKPHNALSGARSERAAFQILLNH